MRYPILVFLTFCLFLTQSSIAQDSALKKHQNNKLWHIHTPNKSTDFFASNQKKLGLSEYDKMNQEKQWIDRSGIKRYRFTQSYKDLPIIGSAYTLHERENLVYKATGNLFPDININVKPTFKKSELEEKAITTLESYLAYQKVISFSNDVNWEQSYDQLCIIDKKYPDFSGNYRLAHAYKIITEDYTIPINYTVYMDAHNGKFIDAFSNIKCGNSKGVAHTRYYGTQEIITDSIAPDIFVLKDATRGDGIETYDYNDRSIPIIDEDNVWESEEDGAVNVAGDAHYCSSKYYDMMQEYFDWDGLDGEGGALVSIVNVFSRYYVNAFWDGSSTYYGNGDCHRYGPLTTMTVVGHEFAHGWTDFTSDLVYRNESGALNESISDIIGKALEYYADRENFTWNIGDLIRRNDDVNFFRSMSDPNLRSHPKYYSGNNWRTSSADNGGVHSNSGVFNHWFYLLVEGGVGQNEEGTSYNIDAFGMRKALDIVFLTQTGYLTPNSTYFDCMYYSLEVAEELYGKPSSEYENVLEAWKAVGLYPGIDDFDISVYIESEDPIVLCPGDEKFVEVIIKNVGRKTIDSGLEIPIYFDQTLSPAIQELVKVDNDLLMGDSIIYTFQAPIINDISKDGNFSVYIDPLDINTLNNETTSAIRASELDGLDIDLERFTLTPSDACGTETISRISYTVRNTGCEIIPEDVDLVFDIVTDKGSFTVERSLFREIYPGTTSLSSIFTTFDGIEGISSFEAELRFADDILPDNNVTSGTVAYLKSIAKGYREDFEVSHNNIRYVIDKSDTYNMDTIVEYYGNQMLAFTSTTRELVIDDCNEPEGFFEGYDRSSELTFCVNAANLENPIFSFDLIQLLNENRSYELPSDAFGAMVRVEIDDFTYPIIYGQKSGTMINHDIALPANYNGELTIEIMTTYASEDEGSFFDNRDIVMFDDFKLYETVDIRLSPDDFGYTIFPNPTSDQIRVYNTDIEKKFNVYVYDQLSREVTSRTDNVNQTWINLGDLPQGVYYLMIMEYGKIITSHKVAKY